MQILCAPVENPWGWYPLLPLGTRPRAQGSPCPWQGRAGGASGTQLELSYLLPTHRAVLRLRLLPSDRPWRSQLHPVACTGHQSHGTLWRCKTPLSPSVRLVPKVSKLPQSCTGTEDLWSLAGQQQRAGPYPLVSQALWNCKTGAHKWSKVSHAGC